MMEWRTSKIKDYETKFPCWVDEDGKKCLNTATYCLTYASLSAGFNIITEANYKEIYTRIHMQEKLFVSCNNCIYSSAVHTGKRLKREKEFRFSTPFKR